MAGVALEDIQNGRPTIASPSGRKCFGEVGKEMVRDFRFLW